MFLCRSFTIKQSNTVLNTIVRYSRMKSKAKRSRQTDPGIKLQSSLFSDKQRLTLDSFNIDDLESDFSNIDMSHREHVDQIEAMKEREKYLIVKQKYFKEKYPNFLTWADKQQIKYLHSKDPEEWTIEKLSEGFPALPDTIKKIIKANWSKKNNNKILNHDKYVEKNWEDFKSEKLKELPEELVEHLNKFSDRTRNTSIPELPTKPPRITASGEFSEIITSYQKLKSKNDENQNLLPPVKEQSVSNSKKPLKETYVMEGPQEVRTFMTLDAYKNKLQESDEHELSEEDKLILKPVEDKVVISNSEIELDVVKYVDNTGSVSLYNKQTNYSHLEYPEKIIIPKEKKKRGCTYKLHDCYYDDDGCFLYRVPGME